MRLILPKGDAACAQTAAAWSGYLPMQNRLKISPSKSSEVNAPVISPRATITELRAKR